MVTQNGEPEGRCPQCGYLTNPGRCPECGLELTVERIVPSALWLARQRWRRRAICFSILLVTSQAGCWFLWVPAGFPGQEIDLSLKCFTMSILGPIAFGWIDENVLFPIGSLVLVVCAGIVSHRFAQTRFLEIVFYALLLAWVLVGAGAAGIGIT